MRIISGKLKGRSINFIKNFTTRPLKDLVKENIFNILNHSNLIKVKIEHSYILDLYSGTGSFGIECISRGGKKVKFIEQDNVALNILKENLNRLKIINQSLVINGKIENILNQNQKQKYNIFFLDPPFSDKDFIKNLNLIKINKIYKDSHIVIIHRDKKTKDELDHLISTVLVKQYGRSKIIFGVFN